MNGAHWRIITGQASDYSRRVREGRSDLGKKAGSSLGLRPYWA
jgi:hypothetical protein